jgi:transcriptional regulator of acetoin/glycerol metabolism
MKGTDDNARVTTAPAADSDLRGVSRNLRVRWLYPEPGGISGALVERLLLGRADDCQVILKGTEASRHHSELVRDGPLVLLRDLSSRNGTFLNGEKISEAPLASGDIVRLGEWVGLVIDSDGDPALGGFQRLADRLWGGPELAAALEPARRAAESELPVILEGETGTGKERVARAIHLWSGRKGPFLAVNCAALPEALAEGELFGYRRGAFTGADRANPGHFQAARGGSLLLDEIGDLPPSLQAKLLRVLEEREVLPLGESRAVSVDVRIIAAGQAPLRAAVEKKQFRGDLYARLDGLTVRLPPLRSRVADVPALFEQFLKEFVSGPIPELEPRLVERLCLHDWPFNVRELELLARRLVTLYAREGTLKRSHLPPEIGEARVRPKVAPQDDSPAPAPALPSDRANEIELLLDALRRHQGNVARAAAYVGISRQRAYRLMEGRSDVDLKTLRRPRHRA